MSLKKITHLSRSVTPDDRVFLANFSIVFKNIRSSLRPEAFSVHRNNKIWHHVISVLQTAELKKCYHVTRIFEPQTETNGP